MRALAEPTPPDLSEPDYIEATAAYISELEGRRTMGRPSVMTKGRIVKFLEALERGNFPEPASAYAGLSYRTVRRWMEDGAKDEAELTPPWYFRHAALKAQATDEDKLLTRIQKAGEESRFWMSNVITLSRRHRERWAERTADELRQATAPTVQVLIGIAPPGTPQNPLPVTVDVKQLEPGP